MNLVIRLQSACRLADRPSAGAPSTATSTSRCRARRRSLVTDATGNRTSTSYQGTTAQLEQADRRTVLRAAAGALGAHLLLAAAPPPSAAAAEAAHPPSPAEAAPGCSGDFLLYTSPQQHYSIRRPASWEELGKPGADRLFRDPDEHSTTLGVSLYPSRVASLAEFAGLEEAGQRLLDAERAKDGTLDVRLLSAVQRAGSATGLPVYDFEYELESTRGTKHILSSVTIARRQLYIANGSVRCHGAGSCADAERSAAVLRCMLASFAVD